jgi:hypothetical protein
MKLSDHLAHALSWQLSKAAVLAAEADNLPIMSNIHMAIMKVDMVRKALVEKGL